jgi:hypothetical protein
MTRGPRLVLGPHVGLGWRLVVVIAAALLLA